MKTGQSLKTLALLALGLGLGAHLSAATTDIHPRLCFVPGAGGGSKWLKTQFSGLMELRNVPADFYDVGHGKTIQNLAANLASLLESKLREDPNYRCHLLGYSMGGIVVRYAANHLDVNHPTLGKIPLSELLLSMTTVASPHRGTPLVALLDHFLGEVDPGVDQLDMEAIKVFNDPAQSETYSPEIPKMPSFSYRSYLNNENEAPQLVEKLGYSGIENFFAKQGQNEESQYRNDGIVPTSSQDFGVKLADIHAPHTYFGQDIGWSPSVLDFYEAHWHFLTGTLSEMPKDRLLGSELLQNFIDSLRSAPGLTVP